MKTLQDATGTGLMSAEDVESLLGIDKSTVYRMAQDGRLPAIKVGRQWRFPPEPIRGLLRSAGLTLPVATASPRVPEPASLGPTATGLLQPIIDLAAELLGVMMVVTDMEGNPVSDVANPCPWFVAHQDDPEVLEACIEDWRAFAGEQEFAPTFRAGPHGFECARALVREGNQLVGMVLAGGVARLTPEDVPEPSDGLYHLTAAARGALLAALPRVAATISRVASRTGSTSRSK
jgi:excisionase family DNA binding protein